MSNRCAEGFMTVGPHKSSCIERRVLYNTPTGSPFARGFSTFRAVRREVANIGHSQVYVSLVGNTYRYSYFV